MNVLKKLSKNKNASRGFTLVELLVALTLFMIIMDITVSVFVSIVQHQKRILAEQEFLNQTSYAVESMSKSIRLAVKDPMGDCLFEENKTYPGYVYLLTRYNPGTDASEGIKFVTKDGACQEFFLDEDGILKESKDQDASKAGSAGLPVSGQPPQAILSSKFAIEHLKFLINGDENLLGASSEDARQPRVTMLLKVIMQTGKTQQEKIIQTTVSQLELN